MKKYKVTISLITGYYDSEYENPKLRDVEIEVEAESRVRAIYAAKQIDDSKLSAWDSYAEEI